MERGGEKTLRDKVTRDECVRYCLNENEFECRSAKFRSNTDYGLGYAHDHIGKDFILLSKLLIRVMTLRKLAQLQVLAL